MLPVPTCPVCGDPGAAPCPPCAGSLPRAPGIPLPAGLDRCVALLTYDDGARDLLAAVKYRNRRDGLRWISEGLASLLEPVPGTVVTWPPTSPSRRRSRGFDQAELLARAAARRWGLPVRSLLRRRRGPPQTGRGAAERHRHAGFSCGRTPPQVIVVDDIATTGATLAAAARALRSAGAAEVVGVVAAWTPPGRG